MTNEPTLYNGRIIYETPYEERKAFLDTIRLKNRKIVWDSVRTCKLACDILNGNPSTL